MLLSTGKEVFLDFTIKIVETSLALMRRKSQEPAQSPITKHVFIFDLEGFSLTVSSISLTSPLKNHIFLNLGSDKLRYTRDSEKADISL